MNIPVTDSGERPVGKPGFCFYCGQPAGDHAPACVCLERTVVIRATIEYVVSVPRSWTTDDIEAHRNEGSWCANNDFDGLAEWVESSNGCLCSASFKFVREANVSDHETLPWPGNPALQPSSSSIDPATVKDRCPICGAKFDTVQDENTCPICGEVTPRDKLITEDDDYLWVE
jgi:hypothetical protein